MVPQLYIPYVVFAEMLSYFVLVENYSNFISALVFFCLKFKCFVEFFVDLIAIENWGLASLTSFTFDAVICR